MAGHYIIICGYNSRTSMLCVNDPASYENRSLVRLADFEAARKSFGTDEDLILLQPTPPNPGGVTDPATVVLPPGVAG